MPVYLLHGFRWPRPLIRIHIILQNLDDAAAEWLVAPMTTEVLRENFEQLYPECMEHLQDMRFVEQYDPEDESSQSGSQPYAYVADVIEQVKLGVDVDEVRQRGVKNDQWAAMMELRDKLAPEEHVGWYVVYCGDEERKAPAATLLDPTKTNGMVDTPLGSSESNSINAVGADSQQQQPPQEQLKQPPLPQQQTQGNLSNAQASETPRGFKKFFGIGKRKP